MSVYANQSVKVVAIFTFTICLQMWCTSCHVAFSWTTGHLETASRIHNPHYFEWQRMRQAVPERAPGDIRCGGLPGHGATRRILDSLHNIGAFDDLSITKTVLMYYYRTAAHIQDTAIPELAAEFAAADANVDLRVAFLLHDIDEAKLRTQLQTRNKKREKNHEIAQVYEMFVETLADMFRNIVDVLEDAEDDDDVATLRRDSVESLLVFETQLPPLRDYFNEAMARIATRFSGTCPHVNTFGALGRQNGRGVSSDHTVPW